MDQRSQKTSEFGVMSSEIKEIGEMGFDDVELTMALEVFSRDKEYLKRSKEKIKRIWEAL